MAKLKLMDKIVHKTLPKPDMCSCGNCGWKGNVTEAITEMESEGWEYPEYQVDYCPKCESEEPIENYYYSQEELKKGVKEDEIPMIHVKL